MQTLRAELHVHTVLSPCAEVEMIPPLIVQEALERAITLIAITDHNASANVAAVQAAAAGSGLTVLPGMELQTQEEVHVLCLFETLEQLLAWQEVVDRHLPALENNPDLFGEQFVVDASGDFICRDTRLLLTSSTLSIDVVFEQVQAMGGLVIPAHVDRKAFGLLTNLGFISPDWPLEALEVSRHLKPTEAVLKFPQLAGYPIIQGGDVHRLEEYMGVSEFNVAAPSLAELRLALRQQSGRSYQYQPGADNLQPTK